MNVNNNFTEISHPDITIGELSGVWAGALINISVEAPAIGVKVIDMCNSEVVGIGIGMPVGVGIIVVVASAVIVLEFALSVSYTVDARLDALTAVEIFVTTS